METIGRVDRRANAPHSLDTETWIICAAQRSLAKAAEISRQFTDDALNGLVHLESKALYP